jgi:hypothetical protein
MWGELIACAAHMYEIDLSRLHADSAPIKFAGLFADQPEDEVVPRLEPGYNPQGNGSSNSSCSLWQQEMAICRDGACFFQWTKC